MEIVSLALSSVALAAGLLQNILTVVDRLPSKRGLGDELLQIRELIDSFLSKDFKIDLKSAPVNGGDVMGPKPLYDGTSEQLEQLQEVYRKLQPIQTRLRQSILVNSDPEEPVVKKGKSELGKDAKRWMTRKLSKKSIPETSAITELVERVLAIATPIGENAIRLYQRLEYREISEGRSDSRGELITFTSPARSNTSSSSGSENVACAPPLPSQRTTEQSKFQFRLSVPDYGKRHQRYNDVRFRNTCLWFVEEKELGSLYGKKYKYTDWRDGSNSSPSLLWCSGRVGIGKSTLVSKLVDDMQRSRLGCAFFYTGVRTAHWAWDVMASLLQKFSELDGQYSPVLRNFLERSRSYEQPPLEILLKSLEELASGTSTHRYIFLDAWDTENMQDPGNFAKILQSLLRTRWRIFITSRSDRADYVANCDVSYRDAMTSESWLECKIEPEDTEKDIQKYIKYKVDTNNTFQDFFSRDEKLRDVLLKTLSKKTDGLYFHAEIQTKLLLEQITSRDLRSTLENLPMSTEDIVEAALGLVTVQPFHLRTLAQTALIWLADQKRPFTMRGLCEALALRRDKQLEYRGSLPSPKADSIPSEDAVIGCCKGLVTIDYGESTAVLAHYYDLAPYLSRYWESSYRSELTYLTLTCVSYLLLQPFNCGTCESLSEFSNLSEMYPFLHYAATCWHLHLRDFWLTASEKKSIPVGELVTEEAEGVDGYRGDIEGLIRDNWRLLFRDRAHNLRLAFQIYMWNRELGIKSEAALGRLKQRVDSMSPLQIATSLQLEDVVRHLLEHPSDSAFAESGLLKQDMEGQTALHAALDHARSPVPHDYDRRWVLFQLIFEKAVLVDFDMMEKSLDRIPSVIANGNYRSSELVQKNLRRILPGIEDGDRREFFDVYLNEIFGSHILSHAINTKNKAALLAMLASNLPSNTDVSAALQDAVKLRSQEFVKVLLTFGANPYIITASGRSCVSEAIANDDLDTLTLLLQRSYYPAPHLRYSAGSADPTSARAAEATLLLEAIKPLPNPTIHDDPGCAMVKALLDQGFPPDALLNGHNPLMQAIKVGRDDIVKLLLERKADPNFAPTAGLLPSFESLRCANSKILQFLLEHGADPNAKFKGRTLLHQASSLARLDLVQTLLEFDADVNGPDDLGRTALFDAVKARNLEIVRRLVEEGVNLLAKDQSNGRYVLHEAAIAGNVKIVSLLLSGYDDISPVDQEKGKTPLDYARELGHLGIVSLLETRFLIRRRSSMHPDSECS